jgi:hypothetical protein
VLFGVGSRSERFIAIRKLGEGSIPGSEGRGAYLGTSPSDKAIVAFFQRT